MELAKELIGTQEQLENECRKTEELASQLSKLSVRNVNKRLKRRDENVKKCKQKVSSLVNETVSQGPERFAKFPSHPGAKEFLTLKQDK